MSDNRQTRSSVARWKEILILTYEELISLGAGDVWVYGSQAMSLYMKRPLASKDLGIHGMGYAVNRRIVQSSGVRICSDESNNGRVVESSSIVVQSRVRIKRLASVHELL